MVGGAGVGDHHVVHRTLHREVALEPLGHRLLHRHVAQPGVLAALARLHEQVIVVSAVEKRLQVLLDQQLGLHPAGRGALHHLREQHRASQRPGLGVLQQRHHVGDGGTLPLDVAAEVVHRAAGVLGHHVQRAADSVHVQRRETGHQPLVVRGVVPGVRERVELALQRHVLRRLALGERLRVEAAGRRDRLEDHRGRAHPDVELLGLGDGRLRLLVQVTVTLLQLHVGRDTGGSGSVDGDDPLERVQRRTVSLQRANLLARSCARFRVPRSRLEMASRRSDPDKVAPQPPFALSMSNWLVSSYHGTSGAC